MNSIEKEGRLEERARAKKIFANPITQGANFKLAAVLYGFGRTESEILEACRAANPQAARVAECRAGAESASRLLGKPFELDEATVVKFADSPSRHAFSNPLWCRGPFDETEKQQFEAGAKDARTILEKAPR